MTLLATTCLGANTVPILGHLAAGLRRVGVDVEFDDRLEPGERDELLRADAVDLVWACGLLTMERIAAGARLEVVAAPVFAGETAARYRSVVVVRSDSEASEVSDTFTGRLAVNELGSWSGYRGYSAWLDELGESIDSYRTVVLTGSHRNSTSAVLEGVADVAAVDHTVWDHLVSTGSSVGGLRVLASTTDWPAPPFSVRPEFARELRDALVGLSVAGLDRIEPTTAAAYEPMLQT